MTADRQGQAVLSVEEARRKQRVEVDHHNALAVRKDWCEWCGHAVPDEDFSTKFIGIGGILTGPFCSEECHWRFVANKADHDLSREERRKAIRAEREREEILCEQCGCDLRDPKNAGFLHDGMWFCSRLHAMMLTGDEDVEVTNPQLEDYVP